ncbi:tuliposide A-converting enzyme 2, chloroplastic-like [Canna indica]|uniref:Tuliposide A-converting enzyme 2, chloroplastic-like n=1 Tax=Canna indica TaxID=4628 RepID=A0AAQ3JRS7_9LILI|nr:tuliposide A-converting enzyme 2, chloroplastic-like [Canna indica]
MDPDAEIEYDFSPYLYLYKSGRVRRFAAPDIVPASPDAAAGVISKDVPINPSTGITARLFLPSLSMTPKKTKNKLPILVYFHGGGFVIGSPFSSTYHGFLDALVARAGVLAVSVDYRLAPEHPLPTAYDDSLVALRWVASHANGEGTEEWLADHGDFRRIFLAGDSAGANIAHNILLKLGDLPRGVSVEGMVLIHPYFWGKHPIVGETVEPRLRQKLESSWGFISGWKMGVEDPRVDPAMEEAARLRGLQCRRVLVVVAEMDYYAARGRAYYETVKGSRWKGEVELYETPGERHVFHLKMPQSKKAMAMRKRIAAFLNGDDNFFYNLLSSVAHKFCGKF